MLQKGVSPGNEITLNNPGLFLFMFGREKEMRNSETDALGAWIQEQYLESGLAPDSFIELMVSEHGAFSCEYLNYSGNLRMLYAAFGLVIKGSAFYCYYYGSRNEWFAKI